MTVAGERAGWSDKNPRSDLDETRAGIQLLLAFFHLGKWLVTHRAGHPPFDIGSLRQ